MAIKNFWSLTVDEALVADRLQNELKNKGYEVFFPLRSQLRDIDLVLFHLKNKISYTIQVKGSRTYDVDERDRKEFGDGGRSWIQINKKNIFETKNPVDYYIFLIHLEIQEKNKRDVELHYLIIPNEDFKKLCLNKKLEKDDIYKFYIWVNPKQKKATEYREWKNRIDLTPYLNNFTFFK